MPFNPDEAAKKLGLDTNIQAAGSSASFDPDKAAQALGLQTLPNDGAIQNGASAADQFAQAHPYLSKAMNATQFAANPLGYFVDKEVKQGGAADAAITHLGQGASLGYNDEAASAISALAPSAGNQSYTEKYASDRDAMRKKIADTANSHPVVSALSELVGGAPIAMLTGNAGPLVNTTLAAINGLGKSNKETAGQAALDVAIPAVTALGLSALGKPAEAKKFITDKYKAFVNQDTGEAVIDKLNPANVGVKVSPRPNGDFEIKLASEGDKVGTAFKLGKEERTLLSNPDTQAKVTDELSGVFGTEERPGAIPTLIKTTKGKLGQVRDGLLKEFGANSTDTESVLKNAYDKASTFDHGGDQDALNAINDFKERVQTIEARLRAASPTGQLKDVPLSVAFAQKQELGDKIFEQGLYRKAPAVQRMTKQIYAGLKDATNAAETTGQLQTINDGFHALYGMSENSINSPEKLKKLTSPTAAQARNAYKDFIEPLLKLDPNTRASMMPELQEYVATDFPKILNKNSIVKAVTDKADSKGLIGWTLNKLYLNKGTLYNTASGLGALRTSSPEVLQSLAPATNAAAASPALNALTVPNQDPQGSLRPME